MKTIEVKAKGKSVLAPAKVAETNLLNYSKMAMIRYGQAVIEERALPDFHDGLKPVQRKIAWAMHKMGLRHTANITKSARVVGDVIGKYHPHGDTGTYGAMVTMASMSQPIVDGHGNWGGMFDDAAAYRYTSAKLTAYGDKNFFTAEYVRVLDLVPNYDGKDWEPVVLPSLLPNLLINGASGIAVATTTNIPPFTVQSLAKLIKGVLKGKVLNAGICYKVLKFNYPYGGEPFLEEKEYRVALREFYRTGVGSATFISPAKWDANKRIISFDSFAPQCNVQNARDKIVELPTVDRFEDDTSIENGIKFNFLIKKSVPIKALEEAKEEIGNYLEGTVHFKFNVTERVYDEATKEVKVSFRSMSVVEFITEWTKWRVDLELRMLTNELKMQAAAIAHTNLLMLAQKNRKLIAQSWEQKDQDAFIMKVLKINGEQAKVVLALNQRQLGALDRNALAEKLKAQNKVQSQLTAHVKKPQLKVLADIDSLLKAIA